MASNMSMKQEIQRVESDSRATTQRCLTKLRETEDIALSTANELLTQGEQLNNVESKLDQMSTTMTSTQRHINQMKSIFGGITNWFNKPPPPPPAVAVSNENQLKKVVQQSDTSDWRRNQVNNTIGCDNGVVGGEAARIDQSARSVRRTAPVFDERDGISGVGAEIDDNLDEMGEGILRLKDLAFGLNSELTIQNSQLDRISGKTDAVQAQMNKQQTQMVRILNR